MFHNNFLVLFRALLCNGMTERLVVWRISTSAFSYYCFILRRVFRNNSYDQSETVFGSFLLPYRNKRGTTPWLPRTVRYGLIPPRIIFSGFVENCQSIDILICLSFFKITTFLCLIFP